MPAEKQSFGPGLLFSFSRHRKEIADAPERQGSCAILQFLSLSLPFSFPPVFIFITAAKNFLCFLPDKWSLEENAREFLRIISDSDIIT